MPIPPGRDSHWRRRILAQGARLTYYQKRMGKNWVTITKAATEAGIHPNTLRWYEKADKLPPVPRTEAGYRMYSPALVNHIKIVSLCHKIVWVEGPIRKRVMLLISTCKKEQFREAVTICEELVGFLGREEQLAKEALEVISLWMEGKTEESAPGRLLSLSQATRFLELGSDQIRNWERNGLILIPRNPVNGYRIFGADDINRLKVIRVCRRAGYSLTAISRLLKAVDETPAGKNLDLSYISDNPSEPEKSFFSTFPSDILLTTLSKATANALKILELLKTHK